MGIIHLGILGGFKNKTGSVVGAYWRSLNVMRGVPRKSNKAPTEAQLLQQSKFKLVTEVLSYISPLIKTGFAAKAKINTPMNLAVRRHLEDAVIVAGGLVSFDYSKLKFSEGPLLPGSLISVTSPAVSQIEFSWENNQTNDIDVDASDKISVLAYNKDKGRFVRGYGVAARSLEVYVLTVPAEWSGDNIMCYYSFSSVKVKNLVSGSEYLGTISMT